MRQWTYSWMSSDGLRHEGEIAAPDKDSAYAELRKRGIRAIKVAERIQPVVRRGLAGLRKRDVTGLAIGALCLAGIAWFMAARSVKDRVAPGSGIRVVEQPNNQTISSGIVQLALPRPRRWLALPADIDLEKVFKHPHEIYLARYALPGSLIPNPTSPVSNSQLAQDFYDNLNAGVVIEEGDAPSVAELKRIVAGMKDDARKYLTVQNGIERLANWLEERQTMEKVYRDQFVERVRKGEAAKTDANEVFRTMGLEELR